MFKLHNVYFDEFDEGSDLGGSSGGDVAEGGEQSPPYFLKDMTEDDLYDRIKGFPDHLSALESRFGESLSPLNARIEEIQKNLGARQSFTPKLEKLTKVLEEYDPNLAKAFMPALEESLRESITASPLDGAVLEPHLTPYLSQLQEKFNQDLTLGLLDAYNIDVTSIIPPVEGGKWNPQSQTHKDFIEWYSLQDMKVRDALAQSGAGFAQALNRFQKWNAGKLKEREQHAGKSVARLNAGQQPSAAGKTSSRRSLESEEDGFNYAFKSA